MASHEGMSYFPENELTKKTIHLIIVLFGTNISLQMRTWDLSHLEAGKAQKSLPNCTVSPSRSFLCLVAFLYFDICHY